MMRMMMRMTEAAGAGGRGGRWEQICGVEGGGGEVKGRRAPGVSG